MRKNRYESSDSDQEFKLAPIIEKKEVFKIWARWAHNPNWFKLDMPEYADQQRGIPQNDVIDMLEKRAGIKIKAKRQEMDEADESVSNVDLRLRQKLGVIMAVLAIDAQKYVVEQGYKLVSENLLPFSILPGHSLLNSDKIIAFKVPLIKAIEFYSRGISKCSYPMGSTTEAMLQNIDLDNDEDAKMMAVIQASHAQAASHNQNQMFDKRLRHRLPESLQSLVHANQRQLNKESIDKLSGGFSRKLRPKVLEVRIPLMNFRPIQAGEEKTRTVYHKDGKYYVLRDESLDVSVKDNI
jgi:hypothetical protein